MELINILLAISWLLSMLLMVAIGFSIAMAMVQKQKQNLINRAISLMEGLKNANRNPIEQSEYIDTTQEQ